MTDELIGFKRVTRTSRAVDDGYQTPIPQNWKQGRTAYGGLTLALAYETAQASLHPLPALRSVQINFVGPVTSDPIFKAARLRQGRNVTSAQITGFIEPDDNAPKIIASGNFIFGAARASVLSVNYPAPHAPPPENCEVFIPKYAKPMVPQFFHNFDTRLIAGGRPLSGAKDGYIRTWSRHADPASREGMASLLCITDVLPPAAIPMFKQMAPISSVSFMLNILVDDPQTKDGWWHVETRQSAAQGGYSSQVMRIWNTDGALVAEGMQCVAVFL